MKTKKMTIILTTAVALGLGSMSAMAAATPNDPSGSSGYAFSDFWGQEPAQHESNAPASRQPAPAMNRTNGGTLGVYGTRSSSEGTWLFPPDPTGGGNN